MSKSELISVIVPIYCIESYIGACIESLIKQTHNNLEIILVDDGSPDRCPDICDLYAKKDNRIKVIHKKNGGLVSARKEGLKIATGKYIGYVDGDDWVEPDYYEKLYDRASVYNAEVVCTGFSRDLFDKCVLINESFKKGLYEDESILKLRDKMISQGDFYQFGITTYVWNKLFVRDVLYKHQMSVDEHITIGEDAAVVYPVFMNCNRVYIDDNVGYHYRQREDSMLKKNDNIQLEIKKIKNIYKYLVCFAKNYGGNLLEQVSDFILGLCLVRFGGKTPTGSYSAFGTLYYDKKIVVYGAGTFGQQLINRFNEQDHCKIVAWVDDDYWEYRRCCLNVDSVESISRLEYDYILVAAIDPKNIISIKNRLMRQDVQESKILAINCDGISKSELLERYLKE